MQTWKGDWNPTFFRLLVILVGLLVVLAAFALVYVLLAILHKFGQVIFLFALGAIIAYILTPLVNSAQMVVRRRWAAILGVYVVLVAALLLLSVLLVQPFISQSQSLIDNLQNPAPSSLEAVEHVQSEISTIQSEIGDQQSILANTLGQPPAADIQQTQQHLSDLQVDIANLTKSPATQTPIKQGQKLIPQSQVPVSFATPTMKSAGQMERDYRQATEQTDKIDAAELGKAAGDAKKTAADARTLSHIMSSTPILILRAQTWLDERGIKFNLYDNFGNAIQQLSKLGASALNNAVGILTKAANLLVNTFLILIISIYFLSDGSRIIRKGIRLFPERYQDDVRFFVRSTDHVLGSYLRGQIVLAVLAGVLGGGGAAVLGVPYAVIIGISTALLELVPVIGPIILIIPPLLISAIFQPLTTTIILLVYFMVFQQIVTNVIGPRVVGNAVGIHPLAAMAAALVGYPIAGFLGSFLAVPTVGILAIIFREARAQVKSVRRTKPQSEPAPAEPAQAPSPASAPTRPAI